MPLKPKPSVIKSYVNEGKVTPQAVDIEEALLGMLMDLIEAPQITEIFRLLKEEYFFKPSNKIIFRIIESLRSKGEPCTVLSVTERAKQLGVLNDVDGPYGITQVSIKAANPVHGLYYFKIVYQKYLLRMVIGLGLEMVQKAYDETIDCFDLLEEYQDKLNALSPKNTFKTAVSTIALADKMIDEIEYAGEQTAVIFNYNIGQPRFDNVVSISRDKILLISGPAGAGKSKFARFLIFSLLERYPQDISVYWVTLEDSAAETIWGYVSSKVFIKAKDLRQKRYNRKFIPAVKEHLKKAKEFDILFADQAALSKDIVNSFVSFCDERPNKFCILVIDNILSLSDRHLFPRDINTMYDSVMSRLLECRQKTKALIIPIHHFKDAQQDKAQRVYGYRPTLVDLKGTEAFRRVPNQVLLINTPKIYKDLIAEYEGVQKTILKRMFIVDAGKNREDASDDDVALIHFFVNLDFDYFKEIEMEDLPEAPSVDKVDPKVIPI